MNAHVRGNIFLICGGIISLLRKFANAPILESLEGEGARLACLPDPVWPLKPLKQNLHKGQTRHTLCTPAGWDLSGLGGRPGGMGGQEGGEGGGWQAKCQLDLHSSVYQATCSPSCAGMIVVLGWECLSPAFWKWSTVSSPSEEHRSWKPLLCEGRIARASFLDTKAALLYWAELD